MIPRIAVLVLAVGINGSHAQDWVVNFNNNVVTDPNHFIEFWGSGPRVTGTNFQAVLLYGTSPSSLTPHTHYARFRVSTTSVPGTWQGGNRTLTGMGNTPGTVITMRVDVFDILQFANYAAAAAGGGILGSSPLFTYTIPAPPLAPDATDLQNFRAFSMVPEPSAIGLGLVGAAALFMARRRK